MEVMTSILALSSFLCVDLHAVYVQDIDHYMCFKRAKKHKKTRSSKVVLPQSATLTAQAITQTEQRLSRLQRLIKKRYYKKQKRGAKVLWREKRLSTRKKRTFKTLLRQKRQINKHLQYLKIHQAQLLQSTIQVANRQKVLNRQEIQPVHQIVSEEPPINESVDREEHSLSEDVVTRDEIGSGLTQTPLENSEDTHQNETSSFTGGLETREESLTDSIEGQIPESNLFTRDEENGTTGVDDSIMDGLDVLFFEESDLSSSTDEHNLSQHLIFESIEDHQSTDVDVDSDTSTMSDHNSISYVQALEGLVNEPVIERHEDGVRLTERGNRLHQSMQAMFNLLDGIDNTQNDSTHQIARVEELSPTQEAISVSINTGDGELNRQDSSSGHRVDDDLQFNDNSNVVESESRTRTDSSTNQEREDESNFTPTTTHERFLTRRRNMDINAFRRGVSARLRRTPQFTRSETPITTQTNVEEQEEIPNPPQNNTPHTGMRAVLGQLMQRFQQGGDE